MKLNASQLESHLQGELAPLYFLSGDETLLVQEAADAIRKAARAQGYSEREVMHVDQRFDWSSLNDSSATLSLFAEKRIVELRMPTGKPGDAGRKALLGWVERPPEDTLLLIITGKLESSVPGAKWFKTLEAAGASLTIWPLEAERMPGWVGARMRARGLRPDTAAVELLAQRVEGNLLAAAQEIDKLQLLHGEGQITVDDIDEAVVDNARFDIYRLVDTALGGDAAQTQRMFNRLQDEGIEPVLLLWVLGRELRSLASMASECGDGSGRPPGDAAVEQVMTRYRVWQKRKPLIKNALLRSGPRRWQGLVLIAARIDRVIKGQLAGNVRDELLQLSLALAGLAVASRLQRSVAQARA